MHRSPSLTSTATTRHKRIAVTIPARTLADLRGTIDPALYRKAVREAEFRNLPLGEAPTDAPAASSSGPSSRSAGAGACRSRR